MRDKWLNSTCPLLCCAGHPGVFYSGLTSHGGKQIRTVEYALAASADRSIFAHLAVSNRHLVTRSLSLPGHALSVPVCELTSLCAIILAKTGMSDKRQAGVHRNSRCSLLARLRSL